MDDELKKLAEKNLRIAEENNRMLKKMYRSIQWGRFLRGIYWLFILGSAFGAYYFLQPYLVALEDATGPLFSGAERLQGISDSIKNPASLLEQFKGGGM